MMEEANTSTEGSLGIQFFFATPYHSWERGANENTNGLARQYIPKGSDFDLYSEENIAEIEWKLNHRPRNQDCLQLDIATLSPSEMKI